MKGGTNKQSSEPTTRNLLLEQVLKQKPPTEPKFLKVQVLRMRRAVD